MLKKHLIKIISFLLLVTAGSAQATLIGSTVNMSAYYPNTSSVFANPGNAIVSGGIEYSAGSYAGYNSSWEIDISANQLVITDTTSSGFPFGSGVAFNGWILDVITGPAILSASVDVSSVFSPFAISIVNGDLLLNYQGVQGPSGSSSVINFTTASAVPAPAPLTLIGLGLLGLGFNRKKLLK